MKDGKSVKRRVAIKKSLRVLVFIIGIAFILFGIYHSVKALSLTGYVVLGELGASLRGILGLAFFIAGLLICGVANWVNIPESKLEQIIRDTYGDSVLAHSQVFSDATLPKPAFTAMPRPDTPLPILILDTSYAVTLSDLDIKKISPYPKKDFYRNLELYIHPKLFDELRTPPRSERSDRIAMPNQAGKVPQAIINYYDSISRANTPRSFAAELERLENNLGISLDEAESIKDRITEIWRERCPGKASKRYEMDNFLRVDRDLLYFALLTSTQRAPTILTDDSDIILVSKYLNSKGLDYAHNRESKHIKGEYKIGIDTHLRKFGGGSA